MNVALIRIELQHLPAANLRNGFIRDRDSSEITAPPCPFCGKPRDEKNLDMHKKLGKRYIAPNPSNPKEVIDLVAPGCCHDKQADRQKRLREGQTVIRYHQTDEATAAQIEQTGKMLRCKDGTAGGAIYFAFTPRETQWKTMRRGVIFECEVQLANMLDCDMFDQKKPPYKDIVFANPMNPATCNQGTTQWTYLDLGDDIGYSILLNRGMNLHKGTAAEGMPSGPEVIVFSWQQILIKKRMSDITAAHPAVEPLGWFHDEINAGFELLPYRGQEPKAHIEAAKKILTKYHETREEELDKRSVKRIKAH